jgi:chaperonin GroEL (HSP60 family)
MIIGAREIFFYDDAHARILTGIETLARVLRVTLGPKARTVVTTDCMISQPWQSRACRAAIQIE